MKEGSVLKRRKDGKAFTVFWPGHWSSIKSEDGQTDSVKWYGGDGSSEFYVSASSGEVYVRDTEAA